MGQRRKNLQMTDRDEAILTDLYFTRILSTEQIQARYFSAFSTAKRRLYDIRAMKYIEAKTPEGCPTVWTLTKSAFEREVEALRREGDPHKGFPKPRAVPHFLQTNDVFIGIADEFNRLLGQPPEWEWKDQGRITQERGGTEKGAKQKGTKLPDAEITFLGNRYCVERQTARARAKKSEIADKVAGHRRYVRRLPEGSGEVELLFACDEDRDMDYALEAAQEQQVAMTAGTPQQIIERLLGKAKVASAAVEKVA